MVTEEWQDYGTLLFCLNGNMYLSLFQSKVRLKNFRMNIMMRLPDVMFQENLPFYRVYVVTDRQDFGRYFASDE